jgi:hypothetical protein
MKETQYENNCRVKFYELLNTLDIDKLREGHLSVSQVVSFMTVLDCDMDTAKALVSTLPKYGDPDWSELSWAELSEFTNGLIQYLVENLEMAKFHAA